MGKPTAPTSSLSLSKATLACVYKRVCVCVCSVSASTGGICQVNLKPSRTKAVPFLMKELYKHTHTHTHIDPPPPSQPHGNSYDVDTARKLRATHHTLLTVISKQTRAARCTVRAVCTHAPVCPRQTDRHIHTHTHTHGQFTQIYIYIFFKCIYCIRRCK